ncbi:MAG: hypothetical protein LBQ71_14830, partial [Hungatella sp.]|nr:hypothetical protein [Hungatella sp.]
KQTWYLKTCEACPKERNESKRKQGVRGTKEKERLADTVSLYLVPLIHTHTTNYYTTHIHHNEPTKKEKQNSTQNKKEK